MGVTNTIKDYGTELLNAVKDNDLKTFKTICEKCLKHDSQIAQLCILDIKHRTLKSYACPLILAARLEDPSIIKYMLSVGTNPNFVHHAVSSFGQRESVAPLHIAVDLGFIDTIEALIYHNADPNTVNSNGETPILIATKRSNWTALRMLLAKGGNPNLTDRFGNAALHIASLYGHLQMVKLLLKHGAELNQKGNMGATPPYIAAREGHVHLVQAFCSKDIRLINIKIPCLTDKKEKGIIHIASEHGHVETVLALVDQFKADINLKDSDGNTPLHCIVLHSYHSHKMRDKDYFYATAKVLVKYKASINEKNVNGETALHLASAHSHPKIVELLLTVGANPFVENNNRMKPIDFVLETDLISKQLLKTAMLNPKPPTNVSSLSLFQNSFYGDLPMKMLQTSTNLSNTNALKHLSMNDSSRVHRGFNHSVDYSVNSGNSAIVMHKLKNGNLIVSPLPSNKMYTKERNILDKSSEKYNGHTNHTKHFSRNYRHRRSSIDKFSSLSDATFNPISTSEKQIAKNYSSDESFNYDRRTGKPYERHQSSGARHSKKSSKAKYKQQFYSSDEYISEIDQYEKRKKRHARNNKYSNVYKDNMNKHGVRVHTIPGKLSTVEVEYDKGPVTIEIEKQELIPSETHHSKNMLAKKTDKPNEFNKIKASRHRKPSREPKLEENTKDIISDWCETMKSYNELNKKANDDRYDSDEVFMGKEYEESSINSSPDTYLQNKKLTKKTNKKKKELSKQHIYDEQIQMEKMPIIDPEPEYKNIKVETEDDDSSISSSTSLEEGITDTQKILNESASKKISEIMNNIKTFWSEDELSHSHEDKLSRKNFNTKNNNQITVKSMQKKTSDFSNNSVLFSSSLIEKWNDSTIRLKTIMPDTDSTNDGLRNTSEINNYENTYEDKKINDLIIRVSGEAPKAFSKKDMSSARSLFMQAKPIRIESSSEASDSELYISKSGFQEIDVASLKRRTDWSKPLVPYQKNVPSTNKKRFTKYEMISSYEINKPVHGPKPYKSFGNIKTKTDALEEALKDTSSASTIIPDRYKIKLAVDEKQTESSENDSPTTSNPKNDGNDSSIRRDRKKNLRDNSLEVYSEEPHFKRKNIVKDSLENSNFNSDGDEISKSIVKKKKNKYKMPIKKNFILPKGFSPEVWEEACNDTPLASSDTFLDVPTDDYYNKDNSGSFDNVNFDGNTDTSKLELDLESLGLDLCIPVAQSPDSSFNEKEFKKKETKPAIRKKKKSKKTSNHVDVIIKDTIEETKTQLDSTIIKLKPKLHPNQTNFNNFNLIGMQNQKTKPKRSSEKTKPPIPDPTISEASSNFKSNLISRGKPRFYASENEADEIVDLNLIPYIKKAKPSLPKYPNKPCQTHGTEDFQKRPYKTRYVHSEAEISDFEPPELPSPGTSFKQAALKSMNTATKTNHYKSFLLRQPGHHDKNFNYLLKLYKPRHKRRCRTRHLFPSAGRYGEYEMRRVLSNRSLTESESEIENMSFISDDQNDYDSFHGSTNSLDRSAAKIENPIYKSLMKYKKLKMMGRDPNKLDSNPFNFPEPRIISLEKYDDIAKIWLEQVDKKTVKKSDTMYLSVLPDGKDLPISLRPSKSYTPPSDFNDNIRPQWVMARSRINIKKQLYDQFSESAFDHNVSTNFGKHLVLFFKVGYNWLELAWILFGDLLKESQIVRLIKDVQLKHPNNLTNQVTDLMQRWWHTKGDGATIQELQKALDLLQIFYIEEELNDNEQPENSHFKVTEDILDVGVVTTKNPNVSRMSEEYNTKSLNNSFINSSRETKFVDDLSPEKVLKKNQYKFNSNNMNELLTSVNKLSRRNPHDESSDASNVVAFGKEENKKDTLDVSSTLSKKTTLKDRKNSPFNHETNL